MPGPNAARQHPNYAKYRKEFEDKFAKMPTSDLLNEWDSEDLIHHLQARDLLRKEALSPVLQQGATLKARQEFENLRKGGSLEALSKLHAETAAHEGMELPVGPDGIIDTAATLKNIQEAIQAKEKRDLDRQLTLGATEQTTTRTNPQGQKTVVGQMMTKTGQPTSEPRIISSEAPQTEPLRKEYTAQPTIHEFNKVDAGYNKLIRSISSTKAPSPLRDQAAIFQWMKILDPGSTVREGEYATVEKARGIPDRIRNWYNQAVTGQNLTPTQRQELIAASEDVVDGQMANVAPIMKQFIEQEKTGGHAPGSVVPVEHQELVKQFEEREAARAAAAQTQSQPAPAAGGAPAPTAAAAPAAAPAQQAQQKPIPVVKSPAEAPPDAEFYMSPDGRKFVNRNYRPPQ